MPRARALVAAVPQRVWAAVAGLVVLASLGVTLVVTAGLSTWQGAVNNSPPESSAHPPGSVVIPPGSAVVVVPTPHAPRPATTPPAKPTTVSVALPPAVLPVAAPGSVPVVVPPVSAPVPAGPVTSSPSVAHAHVAATSGRGAEHKHSHRAKHLDHGKHLGWYKHNDGRHI